MHGDGVWVEVCPVLFGVELPAWEASDFLTFGGRKGRAVVAEGGFVCASDGADARGRDREGRGPCKGGESGWVHAWWCTTTWYRRSRDGMRW